jgi:hypothetical protein
MNIKEYLKLIDRSEDYEVLEASMKICKNAKRFGMN